MIRLLHLRAISATTVHFLSLGKSITFPPKWKKASLGVSEDRTRIPWRTESVESSVVSVSLCILDHYLSILSKDPPILLMRADLFKSLTCTIFCVALYFFSNSQRQCDTETPSLQPCRYLTSMPSYIICFCCCCFFSVSRP